MTLVQRLNQAASSRADPIIAIAAGLALLSLIEGAVALLSACFLAGILAGIRDRVPAVAAIVMAMALQIAMWPDHFRLEAFSPVIGVVLAPISVHFTRHRHTYVFTLATLLVGLTVIVAVDRGILAPHRVATALIAAAAVLTGLVVGALLDSALRRDAAWSKANVTLVARDLLLGRITTGMIHDLAQPINVVSMANGNLSYLLDNMPHHESTHDLLQERVHRIAGQTDKAAHLLHNFRSFGREDLEPGAVLTVRDALERSRTATTSNVRHGGVAVELRGDALDCIGGAHLGILQMAVAGSLLSAFAGYSDPDGDKRDGIVVVDARLASSSIIVTVTARDENHEAMSTSQPDPVLAWLLAEVLASVGGRFQPTVWIDRSSGMRLTLPHKL